MLRFVQNPVRHSIASQGPVALSRKFTSNVFLSQTTSVNALEVMAGLPRLAAQQPQMHGGLMASQCGRSQRLASPFFGSSLRDHSLGCPLVFGGYSVRPRRASLMERRVVAMAPPGG